MLTFTEMSIEAELAQHSMQLLVVLNLYKLTQSVCTGFDVFDSCVVAARSKTEARLTHPSHNAFDRLTDEFSTWPGLDRLPEINVELIGTAIRGVRAGRICSSFKAG